MPANLTDSKSSHTIDVSTKGITFLKFNDHNGKIVSHTDYFDYPLLNKLVESS